MASSGNLWWGGRLFGFITWATPPPNTHILSLTHNPAPAGGAGRSHSEWGSSESPPPEGTGVPRWMWTGALPRWVGNTWVSTPEGTGASRWVRASGNGSDPEWNATEVMSPARTPGTRPKGLDEESTLWPLTDNRLNHMHKGWGSVCRRHRHRCEGTEHLTPPSPLEVWEWSWNK